MPTPARDQPWYSFDYGFVHFTFMSTEHDYSIGTRSTTTLLPPIPNT